LSEVSEHEDREGEQVETFEGCVKPLVISGGTLPGFDQLPAFLQIHEQVDVQAFRPERRNTTRVVLTHLSMTGALSEFASQYAASRVLAENQNSCGLTSNLVQENQALHFTICLTLTCYKGSSRAGPRKSRQRLRLLVHAMVAGEEGTEGTPAPPKAITV
jgi:hypothetical protein